MSTWIYLFSEKEEEAEEEERKHRQDKSETKEGDLWVAQWLRIRLPMQGTRVRALVREDPTRRGATKPMRHNY